MKRLFRRRARTENSERALEAERAYQLIEESREIVLVLDSQERVIAASRRARESLQGVVEGAPLPDRFLAGEGEAAPLRVPYDAGGRRETLLYLSRPGDLAAYQELRAGFTAAVSHELRTPLARLMALLESAELPGADTSELVDRARREVEQARELIDDVLFLSELESGREVVSLGTTRALPGLEQVVAELREPADRAGIELRLDCSASVELPLRQRMLEVVAKNLAENAIRYAGAGSTVTLAVDGDGGAVVLRAADDGAGVPDEDLPRLFERFFRGDRARASRGSGLGLAIVKHIVEAAGGAVAASETPGGGLTVTARFPPGNLIYDRRPAADEGGARWSD